MQQPDDENAAGLLTVEHNVSAALHTAQAGPNMVTGATQSGISGQTSATILKLSDITVGLGFTPRPNSIIADAQQVCFGKTRETKPGHRLNPLLGMLERLADPRKDVIFGKPAGIAFINGCA
jgi:hypothetical protein